MSAAAITGAVMAIVFRASWIAVAAVRQDQITATSTIHASLMGNAAASDLNAIAAAPQKACAIQMMTATTM
jgi:hypothetical protein